MSIENQIINLDSRFTNIKNSNKYIFNLENPYKNVTSISLTSIELPNVFYTFTSTKKNNFIVIEDIKVSIQEGNYSVLDLFEFLNSKLATIKDSRDIDIEISYSSINGKTTIKELNNKPFSLTFLNDSAYQSLGYHLGFRKNHYTSSYEYISEAIIDIIGDNYIFVRINDYETICNLRSGCKYFAKIILATNKYTVVFDNNSNFITKKYNFLQPTNINKINIELYDLYDNEINMNYQDFSLTLEIKQIYNYKVKQNLENFSAIKTSEYY